MKGIYKAIIGIVTTGTVATAGIVTANILSENKETKPVAIVNEMENTVNEENKIEENIIENKIENNIQDNNTQKNNIKNTTTKPDTTINNNQPVVEVPQETVKNEDTEEELEEKEVVLNLHLKRNVDIEETKTYTIIVKDDMKTYEENVNITDEIDLAIKLKGYETTHRIHIFIDNAIIGIRDIDFKTQSSYDFSFELSS